jgi:hypothetical protein
MNLKSYIEGIRKGRDINLLERAAMQDPFLADALAGYDQVKGNYSCRIEEMTGQVILQTQPKNKTFRTGMIAAVILVLTVSGFYIFSSKRSLSVKDFVRQEEKKPEPPPFSRQETDSLPFLFALSRTAGSAGFAIPDSLLSFMALKISSNDNDPDSIAGREKMQNPEENADKKDKILSPKPAVGYGAYYKYLKTQLIRPADETCSQVKGKVLLAFSINGNGRPEEIRVIQSLCPSADTEAIRLVKEGPGWTAGETEVRIVVRFM